jgi:hypothetical protein
MSQPTSLFTTVPSSLGVHVGAMGTGQPVPDRNPLVSNEISKTSRRDGTSERAEVQRKLNPVRWPAAAIQDSFNVPSSYEEWHLIKVPLL